MIVVAGENGDIMYTLRNCHIYDQTYGCKGGGGDVMMFETSYLGGGQFFKAASAQPYIG